MSTPVRIEQLPRLDGVNGTELVPLSQNGIVYAVLSAALRNNNIYFQAGAPPASAVNDLWIDTANGNAPSIWNGSAWVDATDARMPTDDEKAALTAASIGAADVVATRAWANSLFAGTTALDDLRDDVVAYEASSSSTPTITFPSADTRVFVFLCSTFSATITATIPTTGRKTGDLIIFRNVNGSGTVTLGSAYESVGGAPSVVTLVFDGVQWQLLETSLDNALSSAQPSVNSAVAIAGAGTTPVVLTNAEYSLKANVIKEYTFGAGTYGHILEITDPPVGPPTVTNQTKFLDFKLNFAASGIQTVQIQRTLGPILDTVVSADGDDNSALVRIYWPLVGSASYFSGLYPA